MTYQKERFFSCHAYGVLGFKHKATVEADGPSQAAQTFALQIWHKDGRCPSTVHVMDWQSELFEYQCQPIMSVSVKWVRPETMPELFAEDKEAGL